MKESEARVIIYLSVVTNTRKYLQAISNKLIMNYSYIIPLTASMVSKGWLIKHKIGRKVFYDLNKERSTELIAEATTLLNGQGIALQRYLKETEPESKENDVISDPTGDIYEP